VLVRVARDQQRTRRAKMWETPETPAPDTEEGGGAPEEGGGDDGGQEGGGEGDEGA